jgi:D-alanine transaminase
MPEIAWVNGRVTPLSEAVLPIDDRGTQYGDGVYEVLRTYGGRLFAPDRHFARLRRSAAAIALPADERLGSIESIVDDCVARAGFPESLVYVQFTRGTAPRAHLWPTGIVPNCVVTVRPLTLDLSQERKEGVAVVLLPDLRWGRCDIKSLNLLPNVLARNEAKEKGALEAVFVDADGRVTEATTSNVFVVRGGALVTPPLKSRLLPGVTRSVIVDLARGASLPLREEEVTREGLLTAEEVILSSTTLEVVPVVLADGTRIGPSGRPGPVFLRLEAAFRDAVKKAADPFFGRRERSAVAEKGAR